MDNKNKRNKKKRHTYIRILHSNVEGLRKKFMEIKHLISKLEPHIIVLNECNTDFDKYHYDIPNYDKLTDTVQPHLGTAMYIKRGLRWNQVQLLPGFDDNERQIEGVAVKICTNFSTGEQITIRGIYIPHVNYKAIQRELQHLLEDGDCINIGDLNLKMTTLRHPRTVGAGRAVQKSIDDGECKLIHTNKPSRPSSGNDHILDVALVTGSLQFETGDNCRQVDSIASDHMPWIFTLKINSELEIQLTRDMKKLLTEEPTRQLYKILIEERLDPTEIIRTNEELDNYIEKLEQIVTYALDITAPKRVIDPKETLPKEIQDQIIVRNQLKLNVKRAQGHQTPKKLYNEAKQQVQTLLRDYKEQTWIKIIENTTDSRTKMWKIQRSLKKEVQKLPLLPGCTTEKETIDTLVETAIVKDASISQSDEETETTTPFQPLEEASFEEVKKAIYSFKNKKAPGPDQIKADTIKLAGPALWNALRKAINYVLLTGYYSERWKLGDCIFLHKSGKNYKNPKSYRPITLLNIMGKICERIMHRRIMTSCKRLIPEFQHGFMSGRGTGTQILRTCKYISDALSEGHSVAMISTDLSKAFDSINHRGLTKKLQEGDVPNNIIKLIENYLNNRKTRGKFRTTTGEEKTVPHGVPQGSILGPVIFNLYVSDLPKSRIAGQMLSQYADDLCILNAAERPDNASTRVTWAAEEVIDYYDRWGLQCNVDKTECIMFTKKRAQSASSRGYKPTVKIKGIMLEYKKNVRYLGVILDKGLTMSEHVKNVIAKAKRIRGMLSSIIGWYSKVNIETKLAVIHACLMPILDYGIVQLLPRISKSNLLSIERQYRMALKSAGGFPKSLPSRILWEMLDEDPWHLRVHDLHHDMIVKLNSMCIEGLTTPGPSYTRYGQFNPMLSSNRVGDVQYVSKMDRDKRVSKRHVPRRHSMLK